MFQNNKGVIYYELLLCLIIITYLISFILVMQNRILLTTRNNKLTYEMKQILSLNIILLENNEALVISDKYVLIQSENKLCIEWTDLNNDEKVVCKKYWD